ncbi:MAG: GDP-mannose 4,6-dehydratase, partial [Chloroflexota bacterium]|nr:GDP-mannose 4,6-dehydratase [Chloroflexota bacterium]
GSQTRSFQYVDDLIEALTRLMGTDYHQPVNVGNPEEYTMIELASIVKELVGSSSPITHEPLPGDDPKQRRPDITRARQLLDWEPQVPLREGLRRTIEYLRGALEAGRSV